MLDEKKKWFLLNSGGGAQALAPNLYGYSKGLTTADIFATDFGASTYTFERDTDSAFPSPTEVQATSSRTLNDTGLTAGVTYYYRVKGDGGGWSQTIGITTIPYAPAFWIEAAGMAYDTDNAYATISTYNISVLKSIITTDISFSKVGANCGLSLPAYKYSHHVVSSANNTGFLASDVGKATLGLNFTIIMPFMTVNAALPANTFWSSNGSTDTQLRTSGFTTLIFKFGGLGFKTYTLPTAIAQNKITNLIITGRQSGSDCLVKMSTDGGTTYTAEQTFTSPTNGPIISRLFSDSAGGGIISWRFPRLVALNNSMTKAEIDLYLNYPQASTYVPRENTTLVPTGITFPNTLPADGIIVNSSLDNNATASYVRHRAWTYGDYTYVLVNKKEASPTFQQDGIYVINWATGMYSDLIELPKYNENAVDYHASGSLPPKRDNTFQHFELSSHYDVTTYQKMMVRQFGDAMNLGAQTALPFLKGMPSGEFVSDFQYFQVADYLNKRVVFGQRFGSVAQYIAYWLTTDNTNNGELVNIIDTGGTNWFYHKLVYREDGVIELFINHYLPTPTSRYNYCFAIRSHINDLNNWSNFGGTWSKDISNNTPITVAEAISNCVVKSAVSSGDAFTYHAAYDPSTDVTAVLVTNGSYTGIQLAISESGAAFGALIDVDWDGLVMNFANVLSEAYDNHFFVIIDGVDSYTVGAATDNAGLNQIAITSTTDGGATWSTPTIFSTDDTKRFQRFYPAHNSQSQARKVIVGAVEVSSTEGSLFVKQL